MFCSKCGAQMGAAARFCPSCGAEAAPASQGAAAAPSPDRPPAFSATATQHPLSFDIKRLGQGDLVVGVSSLILFITLFLPWYSIGLGVFSVSFDGLAQDWMYLVLILTLGLLGLLVSRALWDGIRLPLPHWQLLVGVTGLDLLLTLLGVLVKPPGTTWSWAGFVALVAAIAAVVGAVVRSREPEVLGADGPAARTAPVTPSPLAYSALQPLPPPPAATVPTAPAAAAPSGASTLEAACPGCGAANPSTNRFCRSCGRPLA